jgi:ADP-heptose:LPS heptosyltransferase
MGDLFLSIHFIFMKKIAIVLSCNGIGDILSSIPLIRYLFKNYNYKIPVFTYNTSIFKNFPYIDVYHYNDLHLYNEEFNFYSTFQIHKNVHTRVDIRQLHANELGIQLLPEELHLEYYPNEFENIDLPDNYIVIHPVKTWPSRTWNPNRWQELVNLLNDNNINVVSVGRDSSEVGTYNTQKPVFNINIKKGLNLINKLDLDQTWHILNKSMMVITMDSGILHLAGTTNSFIVQLGSSINPKFRSPYRFGSQKYKYEYILGDCDLFCASNSKYNVKIHGDHKKLPPVPFCLERIESIGQNNNLDTEIYQCHPSVDKVYKKIKKIIDFYKF